MSIDPPERLPTEPGFPDPGVPRPSDPILPSPVPGPTPAPMPEPMPGYDPGPPVRIVDPTPDGPAPGIPIDGAAAVAGGGVARGPGDVR